MLLWTLSDLEFLSAPEQKSQGTPTLKGQVEKQKQTGDRWKEGSENREMTAKCGVRKTKGPEYFKERAVNFQMLLRSKYNMN